MSGFALFLYICGAVQMAMFISHEVKDPDYWYYVVWPITGIAALIETILKRIMSREIE